MAPSAMGYFVGKFISHRKGFGFVESDEEYTRFIYTFRYLNGAR
ncbi:MAG: hypothetical protein ACLTK8_01650 [Paeniclostridium sp.]